MSLHHPILTILLVSVFLLLSTHTHAQGNDMHHRMDDLVDSVQHAVKDADSAGKNKEVIDLGQSLHLLETKFSGLRAALTAELGAKAAHFTSNADVAKKLMEQSTDLVQGIIAQRDELRKLSSDVKEVDSAIRAIKEGLMNFERDAADLSRLVGNLHISHNELTSAHKEAKASMKELVFDKNVGIQSGGGGKHGLFYGLLMVEIAMFVVFLYFKRPGSAVAHKAYGKYG